ncbi:carboxypeptidase-like regulatory domain-containing protein [Prevotella sp. 10(H)]|uniref:carboxypeptidase-like regulatory domain-containing protein n=1 Tax=Prevotella sp. 10(H) TaxID=1158294 RepID=UPI0004A6B21D|nr:carboxypeptidase-like regulatory domain-containing protein [Prevotella sp. 10(H)]
MHKHIFLSLILTAILIPETITSQNVIKGCVTDAASKSPVEFASIGILNKDIGTVADFDGCFSLNISQVESNDSIRFSSIGFESKTFLVKEIIFTENYTVQLVPKSKLLNEVIVLPQKYQYKVLGNNYKGKKIVAGFKDNLKGSECGILINPGKKTILGKLICNVAACTYDSIFYRINVYKETGVGQFNNILDEPVYFSKAMNKKIRSLEIDLTRHNIEVSGKTLITIEHVKDMGEGYIMFSSDTKGADTFSRKASEGKWVQAKINVGFSVGLFVEE